MLLNVFKFCEQSFESLYFSYDVANSIIVISGPGCIDWSCVAVSNSVTSTDLSLFLEVFLTCLDRSRERIRQ